MVALEVVKLDVRDSEVMDVTHRQRAGTLSVRLVSPPPRSLWSVLWHFGYLRLVGIIQPKCLAAEMRGS